MEDGAPLIGVDLDEGGVVPFLHDLFLGGVTDGVVVDALFKVFGEFGVVRETRGQGVAGF